jgi:disulfide bond formation protein DsbB
MATALLRPDRWLIAVLGLSIALLLAVHGFERFGGYPPCELCLRQREAWWTAGTIAALGLMAQRFRPGMARIACVLAALACLAGAAIAAYHAGVEWKWWPGPATCTGRLGRAVTGADVAAALSGAVKVHMVRCDEAAVRWFGLSMAGWNVLVSLGAATGSVAAALRNPRRR